MKDTGAAHDLADRLLPQDPKFATKQCHAGQEPEQWSSWSVVTPICLTTTFKQDGPAQLHPMPSAKEGFEYSRAGNPTRSCLENCLASLEQGKYGFTFASGLAATVSCCHLLKAGDHLVAMDDMYGGTFRYYTKILSNLGVEIDLIDARNLDNVKNAIKPNTKMVWIETPTNPTLKVIDIRGVCNIAHAEKHKEQDILVVIDNTFQSSYFQKPLLLGADIVLHSVTKYLNGHTDVCMGALITSRDDLNERLYFLQKSLGTIPSPFDCYLVLRSLKTLSLRMEEHQKNGFAVARFLENHSCVEKVVYPGLPSHPHHDIAVSQGSGFSGMVSFYVKGGLKQSERFLKQLKLVLLAESLGGCDSLAELPCIMTHSAVAPEHRQVIGITDTLIRLSIGLENQQDIIHDLDQALNYAVNECTEDETSVTAAADIKAAQKASSNSCTQSSCCTRSNAAAHSNGVSS